PGDVILVETGTYDSPITIAAQDSGVTILGESKQLVTISGAVDVNAASDVTLQGIRLDGGLTLNSAVNVLVNDCLVKSKGITVTAGSDIQLVHNEISASATNILLTGATSGGVIEHNLITGGGTGISVTGGSVTGLELRDNRITGSTTGISLSAAAAGHIAN